MQPTVDEGWKPNLCIEFPAFEVGIYQGSTKDQLFCHRPDNDHCDHQDEHPCGAYFPRKEAQNSCPSLNKTTDEVVQPVNQTGRKNGFYQSLKRVLPQLKLRFFRKTIDQKSCKDCIEAF